MKKKAKPRKPKMLRLRKNMVVKASLGLDFDGIARSNRTFLDFDCAISSISAHEARRLAAWLKVEYAPWAEARDEG